MSNLYKGAKISDYRFRRLLELYVRDVTATDAAAATGLSINSANAIFQKLRRYFYDVGLFIDLYQGEDPMTVEIDDPAFEAQVLAFHMARLGVRRGVKESGAAPPYHFAESCWRYDFQRMMIERPSDAVYAMMQKHLLELIRLCGPIGQAPKKRLEGLRAVMRQADERIDWFSRSAPGYRDADSRAGLADARAIAEDV